MKKLLSLMLAASMVLAFSACSNDEEKKDEKEEKEEVEGDVEMEEALEEFLDNLEDEDYRLEFEEDGMSMVGTFYTDGTFEYEISEDGYEMIVVCGVDDEYSVEAGGEKIEGDDAKELCEAEDMPNASFTVELIDDSDLPDVVEDARDEDAEFTEKDDYYVITSTDEDEDIEFRVYKDGSKIMLEAEDGKMVLEIL